MLNNTIKSFITSMNLSPSRFADEIGVQRSSISHILSGRNKPSLDIVQKIIRRYPEIGTQWLLEEPSESDPPAHSSGIRNVEGENNGRELSAGTGNTGSGEEATSNDQAGQFKSAEKQIVKIVVFYSDGTFSDFSPAGN